MEILISLLEKNITSDWAIIYLSMLVLYLKFVYSIIKKRALMLYVETIANIPLTNAQRSNLDNIANIAYKPEKNLTEYIIFTIIHLSGTVILATAIKFSIINCAFKFLFMLFVLLYCFIYNIQYDDKNRETLLLSKKFIIFLFILIMIPAFTLFLCYNRDELQTGVSNNLDVILSQGSFLISVIVVTLLQLNHYNDYSIKNIHSYNLDCIVKGEITTETQNAIEVLLKGTSLNLTKPINIEVKYAVEFYEQSITHVCFKCYDEIYFYKCINKVDVLM